MAFDISYFAEKRALVNPKNLRFTQADIKSTFKDATHPSVRDTASLIRRGQLSPDVFGDLHVSIDEEGRMWCDNNRRLFAFREAGVHSVPVVFDGTRRPTNSLKSKLNDPAFIPRIRGEASRVRIPPPPTSERNAYKMQKETSPLGSVSAGYRKRQIYNSHQDHEVDSEYSYSNAEESALKDKYLYEDEDELEVRFTQLDIKSTFSDPTHRESASLEQWGELDPDVFGDPTVHRDKKGVMWCDNNSRLYANKEAEDDSLPVNFFGNRRRKNAVENKRNDPAFMPRTRGGASGVQIPPSPTSGRNAYQMEKETSLPGSVSAGFSRRQMGYVSAGCSQRQMGSVSAGYCKRQLYNSHQDHEVNYKYSYSYKEEKVEVEVECEYPVPYEDEGKVGYEYPVLCEDKDNVEYGYTVPYEDEGKVGFEYLVPCEAEGKIGCDYPVSCEAYGAEGEVGYDYSGLCEDHEAEGEVEPDYLGLCEDHEAEGEVEYDYSGLCEDYEDEVEVEYDYSCLFEDCEDEGEVEYDCD